MHADRAYAISVMTLEDLFLLCFYVVYLVGVSCGVDNNVIFQIVQVESLVRHQTMTSKELLVSD